MKNDRVYLYHIRDAIGKILFSLLDSSNNLLSPF